MDTQAKLDNSGVEFASIDELLDGDEDEEEVPPPPTFKPEAGSQDIKEESEASPPAASVDDLLKEDEEMEKMLEDTLVDELEEEVKKEPVSYPPLNAEMMNIFASSLLDDIINQKELQGALKIKPNSALEGEPGILMQKKILICGSSQ